MFDKVEKTEEVITEEVKETQATKKKKKLKVVNDVSKAVEVAKKTTTKAEELLEKLNNM